ncbi:MAG: cation transporter [Nitrospirae bacterium]|nr:cation transporter [Nitrospirota bacterium]MCL5237272.1 cation transporter [Nitrospirota bacterium]
MSYYIHNVPGRLRMKSPAIKKNEQVAGDLKKILSTMNGIATVDINLTTGSLLVNYNPKAVDHRDIVGILQRKGYFDTEKAATNDQYIHSAVSKAGHMVSKAVFGAVVEKAFEGSALSLLAVLL